MINRGSRFATLHDVFEMTTGPRLHRGPGFLHLKDALRYVAERQNQGSFLIRRPDGRWYRTTASGSAVFSVSVKKP